MLLLVHGEVTDPEVDFFDREKVFIQTKLKPLLDEVRRSLPAPCRAASCCHMPLVMPARAAVWNGSWAGPATAALP